MKDNRGITLVELIVSVSIFGVVIIGMLSLVNMSTKLYSSEKTDVNMQYEAQTALNLIMDYAMQAQGVTIVNDLVTVSDRGGNAITKQVTKGLLLGEFVNAGGSYEFTGVIIAGDYNDTVSQLYMKSVTGEAGGSTVEDSAEMLINNILNLSEADRKKYIMAEHIRKFFILPAAETIDLSERSYKNPFSMDITLELEAVSQKTIERKSVEDRVTLRNRIDEMHYKALADTAVITYKEEE